MDNVFNNVQNSDSYINIPWSTFESEHMVLFTDMLFLPEVQVLQVRQVSIIT
jgi:hypothetical protein